MNVKKLELFGACVDTVERQGHNQGRTIVKMSYADKSLHRWGHRRLEHESSSRGTKSVEVNCMLRFVLYRLVRTCGPGLSEDWGLHIFSIFKIGEDV